MNTSIWQTIFFVLIGLFSLNIMVLIHEFGHLLASFLFKIEVDSVQLGFGPTITTFKRKNMKFVVSAIPFGGACKTDSLSLYSVHPLKRIGMYFAGSLMNVIFAIVFFTIYLLINNYHFFPAIVTSFRQCEFELKIFIEALGKLFTGQAKFSEILSGTFKASESIGNLTTMSFKNGFVAGINMVLYLFASVNFSLGIANLFPLPALDGGNILISLVELIFRRTFSEKFYSIVQIIGLVLLLVIVPVALILY